MKRADAYNPGSLLDVPFGEWAGVMEFGEKELYRARQVQEWVFARRAKSFDQMTNLPEALRKRLAERFALRAVRLAGRETSADGTSRLTFEAGDGGHFPAVFLTNGEEEDARYSLCLSSQIGCAWGCSFCASGRVRLERNLLASEILEQLFWTEEALGRKIQSALFMGMGEPLANYNNLLWALRCLRSPLGVGLGARHVTVSTSGLVPQILKLSTEGPKVNLAVSLHAADDETRQKIMPKAARWPIKEVLKAAWIYQKQQGSVRVTFEYVLLKGINDSLRAAQRLSNLLREKKAWVNLIVYNPVPGLLYDRPPEETVKRFTAVLTERGIFVRVRRPLGRDIAAGCGQLGAPKMI